MPKHPSDRKQRLIVKRKKYEEDLQVQTKAGNLRQRRERLKEQETEDELRAAYGGVVEGQL